MISARLVATTQPVISVSAGTAEELVAYCARVSNPSNQDSHDTSERLLKYCIKNRHWSVFEMANAVVEVEAPRDITRQLLRHRSFSFQEFSQRYAENLGFCEREVRAQDHNNRQNSLDYFSEEKKQHWNNRFDTVKTIVENYYVMALEEGVAKECARVMLPEGLTMSRLYVNGTLRSWLHYLEVRTGNGTQKEHIDLSNKIKEVLLPAFPVVMGMMDEVS